MGQFCTALMSDALHTGLVQSFHIASLDRGLIINGSGRSDRKEADSVVVNKSGPGWHNTGIERMRQFKLYRELENRLQAVEEDRRAILMRADEAEAGLRAALRALAILEADVGKLSASLSSGPTVHKAHSAASVEQSPTRSGEVRKPTLEELFAATERAIKVGT